MRHMDGSKPSLWVHLPLYINPFQKSGVFKKTYNINNGERRCHNRPCYMLCLGDCWNCSWCVFFESRVPRLWIGMHHKSFARATISRTGAKVSRAGAKVSRTGSGTGAKVSRAGAKVSRTGSGTAISSTGSSTCASYCDVSPCRGVSYRHVDGRPTGLHGLHSACTGCGCIASIKSNWSNRFNTTRCGDSASNSSRPSGLLNSMPTGFI